MHRTQFISTHTSLCAHSLKATVQSKQRLGVPVTGAPNQGRPYGANSDCTWGSALLRPGLHSMHSMRPNYHWAQQDMAMGCLQA